MTASVYIVADDDTKNNLYDIVCAYNSANIKPDEIVINAYGVNNDNFVEILRKIKTPDNNNVILYARKSYGSIDLGLNGASSLTNKDIVLFHNIKTIPNSKRVEIVKNYFENYGVYVLHHTYNHNSVDIDDNSIFNSDFLFKYDKLYSRYYPFNEQYNAWQYTRTYGQELGVDKVDMYSVCVNRVVLNNIKWKNQYQYELYRGSGDGCGYEFALENLYKYKKCDILNVPLTIMK